MLFTGIRFVKYIAKQPAIRVLSFCCICFGEFKVKQTRWNKFASLWRFCFVLFSNCWTWQMNILGIHAFQVFRRKALNYICDCFQGLHCVLRSQWLVSNETISVYQDSILLELIMNPIMLLLLLLFSSLMYFSL